MMSTMVVRNVRLSGKIILIAASMWLATPNSTGQAATPPITAVRTPVYDVVSIHLNKSGSGAMRWNTMPDSFTATNITLMLLLQNAYGVREDQVSGAPKWANSANFNINAKVDGANLDEMKKLTDKQHEEMLRAILADRFKLKAHIESRVLPVYDLVIAKGGLKMKESAPDTGTPDESELPNAGVRHGWTTRNGNMTANQVPVARLTTFLAQQLQRTVIDKTGLTGNYDFKLTSAPENGSDPSFDSSTPSLFTALEEQLGLKLQTTKGPVDPLVIDHVEMPSEN